jgi:imidazolonepropionase-like amidohydrolase
LIGAGIPQREVIAQASWRGREWLGLPGLVEGAPGDLIVYEADPRRDLAAVMSPQRMILRGAVVA